MSPVTSVALYPPSESLTLPCVPLPRVCEYVGTLEHTHFSDGASQPPLTISQPQKASGGAGLLGDPECGDSAQEQSLEQENSLNVAPVLQPLSIQELVREGSRGRASDSRGGSLMTGSIAAKAVLTLSTQADRWVKPMSHTCPPAVLQPSDCSWVPASRSGPGTGFPRLISFSSISSPAPPLERSPFPGSEADILVNPP